MSAGVEIVEANAGVEVVEVDAMLARARKVFSVGCARWLVHGDLNLVRRELESAGRNSVTIPRSNSVESRFQFLIGHLYWEVLPFLKVSGVYRYGFDAKELAEFTSVAEQMSVVLELAGWLGKQIPEGSGVERVYNP